MLWPDAGSVVYVKCQSLLSLLKSLNQTHIDYFSLDVEGSELFILQSVEWDQLSIEVLTIDTGKMQKQIIQFMKSRGYLWIKTLQEDDVFKKIK